VALYLWTGEERYRTRADVILQSSGAKEYCLRKNTVHPWPVAEAMPKDMGYEKEIMPLLRCTLRAGDWLYIPAGYWHKAQSHDESISLAIGVMSPTSLDLLDYVRSHLASSLRWRQRLPPSGDVSPFSIEQLADQFQELGRDLGEDLARLLADRAIVLDYLASRGRATMPPVEN
jgi:ribosomal protein L16 Arg81 hydroxylase